MKQEEEIIIRKVLKRKDGIKMAIIPKKSKIDGGDYVRIIKLDKEVKYDRRGS